MNVTSGQNSFRVSLARAIFLLRSGRFRDFFSAFSRKLKAAEDQDENELYQRWIQKNEPDDTALAQIKNWCASLKQKPLVTLVIKNPTDPALVNRTLESIRQQAYPHWEVLIQSNDPGILSKIDFNDQIRRFQNNVSGNWIATVVEGDTLARFALSEVIRTIEIRPNLELIYSDHDWINESGRRIDPFFKPDWSPEFLESSDYIGRVTVYNATFIETVPSFWDDERSWLTRVSRKRVETARISKVLYHYYSRPAYSFSKEKLSSSEASVSILIPTRDQAAKLKCAVNSILEKTTYPKYEILIIDNASSKEETLKYFEEYKRDSRIRIIHYDLPFNFSAINNFAVSQTSSEYVVLLNDDTELITPQWLEEMLQYCCRTEIGAVGAKLLYRDKTIQHAGILIGLPEIAVHAHRGWSADSDGYKGRLRSVQNFNAVTAACMMTKRKLFLEVGGFDEKLPLAYNDVDLCLRLRDRGYRIVWTPHAELFHDESASRGYEATLERQKRLSTETDYFLQSWRARLETGDEYYNPNLSLQNGAFRIRA